VRLNCQPHIPLLESRPTIESLPVDDIEVPQTIRTSSYKLWGLLIPAKRLKETAHVVIIGYREPAGASALGNGTALRNAIRI